MKSHLYTLVHCPINCFEAYFFQKHLNFHTWWPIGRCQPSNHLPKWSPKLVCNTSTSLHQNFEGSEFKSCCLHPATAIMVPLDQGSRRNMDQVLGKENPWPLVMFQICDFFVGIFSRNLKSWGKFQKQLTTRSNHMRSLGLVYFVCFHCQICSPTARNLEPLGSVSENFTIPKHGPQGPFWATPSQVPRLVAVICWRPAQQFCCFPQHTFHGPAT